MTKPTNIRISKDRDRIHDLSFIPGGCTIIIVYFTKQAVSYNKVHYPMRYLNAINNIKDIVCVYIDGKKYVPTVKQQHLANIKY